ncbi:MAG: PilZ domain-containing protein [Nitrospiraceae bacterium]
MCKRNPAADLGTWKRELLGYANTTYVRYQVCLDHSLRDRRGELLDLSLDGCRIETTLPLPVNTYLELRILPSIEELPILIDLAAVRWVHHQECGIQFLAIHPPHRERLRKLLQQTE